MEGEIVLYPPSDLLVSHVFHRFLSQFSSDFDEISQGPPFQKTVSAVLLMKIG